MENNRGVALIIVLLVTALLTALVFEFAYGTRVSLRAAMNYRDSQRAYFLARSGINAFIKYPQLRDIPQGEWAIVPMISTGDTEVRIKWEDEMGKICINNLQPNAGPTASDRRFTMLTTLFTDRVVSQEILTTMAYGSPQYSLLSALHILMKDEDYNKVASFMTIYSDQGTFCSGAQKININNASEEVLRCVQAADSAISASDILSYRKDQRYGVLTDPNSRYFTSYSPLFKVYSYATVGGYTKQIEAIVNLNSSTPPYWKAL